MPATGHVTHPDPVGRCRRRVRRLRTTPPTNDRRHDNDQDHEKHADHEASPPMNGTKDQVIRATFTTSAAFMQSTQEPSTATATVHGTQ
jgi:hypothetical protein